MFSTFDDGEIKSKEPAKSVQFVLGMWFVVFDFVVWGWLSVPVVLVSCVVLERLRALTGTDLVDSSADLARDGTEFAHGSTDLADSSTDLVYGSTDLAHGGTKPSFVPTRPRRTSSWPTQSTPSRCIYAPLCSITCETSPRYPVLPRRGTGWGT
eukprot:912436-Rhodomonas_salina.1